MDANAEHLRRIARLLLAILCLCFCCTLFDRRIDVLIVHTAVRPGKMCKIIILVLHRHRACTLAAGPQERAVRREA